VISSYPIFFNKHLPVMCMVEVLMLFT